MYRGTVQQYNSIYIYICAGQIGILPGGFFLLIPFFRLYVEGGFFVDGKCGGGGGVVDGKKGGDIWEFFLCV